MQLKKHTCIGCGGSGHITCPHCNGHGGYNSGSHLGEYRADHHNYNTSYAHTLWMTCSYCSGHLTLICDRCHGMGYIEFYE